MREKTYNNLPQCKLEISGKQVDQIRSAKKRTFFGENKKH